LTVTEIVISPFVQHLSKFVKIISLFSEKILKELVEKSVNSL